MVNATINGIAISVEDGTTILEAARKVGVEIPTLCYLKEVNEKRNIIPAEFSNDGYRLFRELSGVVHGNCSEKEALLKFNAFYRLVTGVLEKIKTNQELMEAIGTLGWNTGGDEDE